MEQNPDRAKLIKLMSEVLSLFFSEPEKNEGPIDAWAGLCGDFTGLCYEHAKAKPEFSSIPFLSKSVYLSIEDEDTPPTWEMKDLPGFSVNEIQSYRIADYLNHCWLYLDGKHYDAAHLEGVDHPFDLRLFRQVFVEVLQEKSPDRLARLVNEHAWWKESKRLLDEFLGWNDAEETPSKHPATGSPGDGMTP